MADFEAIEMFVGGLVLDPNNQHPVVVLKDESGTITLPIWIGVAEATSIASALKSLALPRPLTHDLFMAVFSELGVRVNRVVITELKDATYYAELILQVGDQALIMDSRPSDALAIAVRASAPIFVASHVLDAVASGKAPKAPPKAGRAGQRGAAASSEEEAQGGEAADGEGQPAEPESSDLSQVDRTKWRDILDDLDPDDFKHKM
jgi:bifunctional DNase/RNase